MSRCSKIKAIYKSLPKIKICIERGALKQNFIQGGTPNNQN